MVVPNRGRGIVVSDATELIESRADHRSVVVRWGLLLVLLLSRVQLVAQDVAGDCAGLFLDRVEGLAHGTATSGEGVGGVVGGDGLGGDCVVVGAGVGGGFDGLGLIVANVLALGCLIFVPARTSARSGAT